MRLTALLPLLMLAACVAVTPPPPAPSCTPWIVTATPLPSATATATDTAPPSETPWETPTPEEWPETATPEPQRGVVVGVSTYLNVRAEPDILAEIVGRLYGGDVVYIVGNSDGGNWLELSDGGWVFAAYVRLEL